jgi:hypothetical protein
MISIVDLNDMLNNKRIYHYEGKFSINDAMLCFVNKLSEYSGISFRTEISLDMLNMDCLVQDGDQYFYDYRLNRSIDMMDNIKHVCTGKTKTSLQVIIGNQVYKNVDKLTLIIAAMIYTPVKFRIVFKQHPQLNEKVIINHKSYIFDRDFRVKMMRTPLQTSSHKYENGICTPR